MKIRFSYIIGLTAALIAGCAAYYSVFGLSQLFAGASTAVIIMASSLEVSKIVSVSLLQRYWNKLSGSLKFYLCVGVFVLVCVTSGGIYGFLSNAYQKTAYKLEISGGQIGLLEEKKKMFEKMITDNQGIINTKTQRTQQLTNLRTTQENRFDQDNNNSSKNRTRSDIAISNKEIQKLNIEIDTLNRKNTSLSDSVNFYSTKILESKASDNVSAEVGPLKYLSELTGQPMDKVVNWFILLLIFVFDPLAVALVVAANRVSQIESGDTIQERPVSGGPKPSIFSKLFKKKDKPVKEKNIEVTPDEVIIEPEVIVEEPKPKHNTNRGFSVNIPEPKESTIKRIGSNKFVKDEDKGKVFFKRNRG